MLGRRQILSLERYRSTAACLVSLGRLCGQLDHVMTSLAQELMVFAQKRVFVLWQEFIVAEFGLHLFRLDVFVELIRKLTPLY